MATTSAVDPATGVVAIDLPCRQCGYNVRGLPPAGACPECGTQVALSLRGDVLRFCDPRWVRKLHRGIQLILWSIAIMIAGIVCTFALGAVTAGRGGTDAAELVSQLIILAASVVGFIGCWWLTEPDPSGLGEDRYGTTRKLIRVTLLMGIVEAVLGLAVELGGALPPWARLSMQAAMIVFQIASLVGLIATLQYLRRLSLRIPDHFLSGRAHALSYGFGISYGIIVALGAIILLLAGSGGTGGAGAGIATLGCIAGIAGVTLLIFAILYLLMLINLGRRLAEQAALAEQMWQSAVVMPNLPTDNPTPPAQPL